MSSSPALGLPATTGLRTAGLQTARAAAGPVPAKLLLEGSMETAVLGWLLLQQSEGSSAATRSSGSSPTEADTTEQEDTLL